MRSAYPSQGKSEPKGECSAEVVARMRSTPCGPGYQAILSLALLAPPTKRMPFHLCSIRGQRALSVSTATSFPVNFRSRAR